MLKNSFLLICLVAAVFFALTFPVVGDENKCAKVFEMNCAECHDIDRGCELLGQSKKDWVELFEFMEQMGADIPDDEQKLLSECLVKPGEAVKKVCPQK